MQGFARHERDRPAAALRDLQRIPGVGASLAADLVDVGIGRVADLRRRSAERLYKELCALRGEQLDRCVLYVFRCAVYFARTPRPERALLRWWNWTDLRIAARSGVAAKRPRANRPAKHKPARLRTARGSRDAAARRAGSR